MVYLSSRNSNNIIRLVNLGISKLRPNDYSLSYIPVNLDIMCSPIHFLWVIFGLSLFVNCTTIWNMHHANFPGLSYAL